MDDTDNLIPSATVLNKQETMFTIALQMLFPFVMAGFGMVAAGIVLDKVQVFICLLVFLLFVNLLNL